MADHGTVASATAALAEFARAADVGSGPGELRRYAVRGVIDTIAVALAARNEDAFRITAATLAPEEADGSSVVWPTGQRLSPDGAALLNGTAAHALDYDDVAEAIHTHPSAVMVPALLNVAEATGASGREILDAFVVGYEVQTAVGAGMDLDRHFGRGWHGTSSIAVLGGAAAVARLLHLDTERIRNAIAIAASTAGGSRQNFGTMTKPFHAGMAARDSVIAARLAAAGLTADPTQIEGSLGYLTNFGDGPEGAARVVETIENPWSLMRTPLNIKPYPCCYRAARTAYAAIQLHQQGSDPAKVQKVLVTMEPRGTAPLIHHRPRTGLEGKFSGEYVLATGLIDGSVELTSFTDESVSRPAAQELLRKVKIIEAAIPPFGAPEWEGGYAAVEVTLTDGGSVRLRVDVPHGHDSDPLTDDELDQKLRQCVTFSGLNVDVDALLAQLWGLDSAEPFRGLTGLSGLSGLSGSDAEPSRPMMLAGKEKIA
jgi:2-methylcitrate dehydratase PrpD